MLWVLFAAATAPLQVARNVMKRGLVADAGALGATLTRFLFGLPFSLAIFAVVAMLAGPVHPVLSERFGAGIAVGAVSQIAATALLLLAMHRAGFAVATVLQQSSLPFAAVLGWAVLGDALHPAAWAGIAATTAGLFIISWPGRAAVKGSGQGALLGLASGASFAVALNAYREAARAFEPDHPIYAAAGSVCVAQALQSVLLVTMLAVVNRKALAAIIRSWRQSMLAGFFGSAASACVFAALAMAPAGPVRAVGVIEAPIAAAAGHRLLRERLTWRQMLGGALAALGVVATALAV